jgi:single-strand DNA-binding protein
MINNVTMIGRLTRDPELRYTSSGTSVASFNIAFNDKYLDNEKTYFFNCIAWGKLGETIVKYFKKGEQIPISGKLTQRSWDDKAGNKRSTVEIQVSDIHFIGKSNG